MDVETARVWGESAAEGKRRGKTISASDGLIGATAVRHGLRVMTRNVADFKGTGARLIDPWEDA